MNRLRRIAIVYVVLATLMLGLYPVASYARPAHNVLGETPRFVTEAKISSLNQRFLDKGRKIGLSDQQRSKLVIDFQTELTSIYGAVSKGISPYLKKRTVTDQEVTELTDMLMSATERIAQATRKVLQPFNLSNEEFRVLVPRFAYLDKGKSVNNREVLMDDQPDQLAAIHVTHPVPFDYLMAGLARKAGIYMSIRTDLFTIGNSLRVYFPAYNFELQTTEREIQIPGSVQRFISLPQVSALYDKNINTFHLVSSQSSISFRFDRISPFHEMYGLNDELEAKQKIVIYEANIKHRTRRFPNEWAEQFRKSIEIHEIMHALYGRRREECLAKDGATTKRANFESASLNLYDLDEAQAQIATFAVLAKDNDATLYIALLLNLSIYRGGQQAVNEAFYNGVLRRVSAKQAPLPLQLDMDTKYKLLLDAQADDVFAEAMMMLKRLAEIDALICD